jgi:Uma2 family endonuclease
MAVMSTAPQMLLTVDEFLVRAHEREGKWELHEGELVCMAPERLGNGLTKFAVVSALTAAIRRSEAPCQAVPDSVGVRVSARPTYIPDALVYCGPRLGNAALEIPDPAIVVEALSPSTAVYD